MRIIGLLISLDRPMSERGPSKDRSLLQMTLYAQRSYLTEEHGLLPTNWRTRLQGSSPVPASLYTYIVVGSEKENMKPSQLERNEEEGTVPERVGFNSHCVREERLGEGGEQRIDSSVEIVNIEHILAQTILNV